MFSILKGTLVLIKIFTWGFMCYINNSITQGLTYCYMECKNFNLIKGQQILHILLIHDNVHIPFTYKVHELGTVLLKNDNLEIESTNSGGRLRRVYWNTKVVFVLTCYS